MTPNPQPLRMPSATDIYDALMGDIELDLVSVNLPTLEQRYKDETPQAKAQRAERYRKAFERYDRAFAEWSANFHLAVSAYRHSAIAAAEGQAQQAEAAALAAIEAHFRTPTP